MILDAVVSSGMSIKEQRVYGVAVDIPDLEISIPPHLLIAPQSSADQLWNGDSFRRRRLPASDGGEGPISSVNEDTREATG